MFVLMKYGSVMGFKILACATLILLYWQLTMADNDRIVFPDEVDDVKAKVVEETKETKTNSIEEPPVEPETALRNMIQVPGNCPPGQKMGADGVCRDVF
ncbi:uncharacterized protein LOC120624769 isoform X1 [Pararge aegeria]|uniref:uncharacterized protein LOC120624769 isoform X1 n=1 Tax=Pararge aegeria TaxID=116150 RepID=UPI0019D0BB42|nr:uncharacterized protein LOC120624769 isoform X1 [Pararge aegeria]